MRTLLVLAILVAAAARGADSQSQQLRLIEHYLRADSSRSIGSAARALVEADIDPLEMAQAIRAWVPERRAPGLISRTRLDPLGVRFPWRIAVPEAYDPAVAWPVVVILHGGVARSIEQTDRAGGLAKMVSDPERLLVFPVGWSEQRWWQSGQRENLSAILAEVKRDFHVDDNRVILLGVSDGGTGAWYQAFADPTPWAGYAIGISNPAVLHNREVGVDLNPRLLNLRDQKFLVINGGRDPLYPAAAVEPYLATFREFGATIGFRVHPEGGHDLAWWPADNDLIEDFMDGLERPATPSRVVWEADASTLPAGRDWLEIEALAPPAELLRLQPHQRGAPPALGIEVADDSLIVTRVDRGSPAAKAGVRSGDQILRLSDHPVSNRGELLAVLHRQVVAQPAPLVVKRRERERELVLVLPEPSTQTPPSGWVEASRSGNEIHLRAVGVRRIRLLLGPDDLNVDLPIRVIDEHGRVLLEAPVEPSLETLLRHYGRTRDRCRLVVAEVVVEVRALGDSTSDGRPG